jgi:hypothetical protein
MTDYDISLGMAGPGGVIAGLDAAAGSAGMTPPLCGGRQFGRKFNKKDYPLLGDSEVNTLQDFLCKFGKFENDFENQNFAIFEDVVDNIFLDLTMP